MATRSFTGRPGRSPKRATSDIAVIRRTCTECDRQGYFLTVHEAQQPHVAAKDAEVLEAHGAIHGAFWSPRRATVGSAPVLPTSPQPRRAAELETDFGTSSRAGEARSQGSRKAARVLRRAEDHSPARLFHFPLSIDRNLLFTIPLESRLNDWE